MIGLEALATCVFLTLFAIIYSFGFLVFSVCILLIFTDNTTAFGVLTDWKVFALQPDVCIDWCPTRDGLPLSGSA